jgi:hypothetical protein
MGGPTGSVLALVETFQLVPADPLEQQAQKPTAVMESLGLVSRLARNRVALSVWVGPPLGSGFVGGWVTLFYEMLSHPKRKYLSFKKVQGKNCLANYRMALG